MLNDMVQEHDEPILKHLQDIQVKFSKADPMGFTLEFLFEPNEYFTNTVLTKEYEMRTEADGDDPFSYEGPEIIKCKGCTIDWKKGKNVTVKLIKKTQKHKNRGTKRTITKTVQNDSFFNFFNPPEVTEGEEEADEDNEAILAADFEIGHFIRERIVPRAVLYFTGEALEEDDFDDEEGDDDDDEGDDDYNEDEDADYNPGQGNKQEQCKQQ
jgi:nucleosome assembly protein 1-like 1